MFDWQFMWSLLPQMTSAFVVTVKATLGAFVLAALLGLFIAVGRRSGVKIIDAPLAGFVEFVRSTPLLVQLYFLFYVMPRYGLAVSPLAAGIIGLGLHYSTYLSEVYRAGIESVPKGQWEAATALDFSRTQTWLRIILPQAVPPIVPMLGNYLILMFKETPLLSAITVVEMMQTAKIIGAGTFRYLEPFTLVGLLFLALSYPSALLVKRLERRWARP